MYQPAGYKRTFYNNLRNYPQLDNPAKRGKSHTANLVQKMDLFMKSQDHWNSGMRKEMRLISNYQNMMDDRLSKPKQTQKTQVQRHGGNQERVYRNSAFKKQKLHESIFNSSDKRLRELSEEDEHFRRTFDERTVAQLQNIFSSNIRQYNASEKPQKHTLVNMSRY